MPGPVAEYIRKENRGLNVPEPGESLRTVRDTHSPRLARVDEGQHVTPVALLTTLRQAHREGRTFLIHQGSYLDPGRASESYDRMLRAFRTLDSEPGRYHAAEAGRTAADLASSFWKREPEALSVLPTSKALSQNRDLLDSYASGFQRSMGSRYSEAVERFPGGPEATAHTNSVWRMTEAARSHQLRGLERQHPNIDGVSSGRQAKQRSRQDELEIGGR